MCVCIVCVPFIDEWCAPILDLWQKYSFDKKTRLCIGHGLVLRASKSWQLGMWSWEACHYPWIVSFLVSISMVGLALRSLNPKKNQPWNSTATMVPKTSPWRRSKPVVGSAAGRGPTMWSVQTWMTEVTFSALCQIRVCPSGYTLSTKGMAGKWKGGEEWMLWTAEVAKIDFYWIKTIES